MTALPPPDCMKLLPEPLETPELAETETSESVQLPAWLRRSVPELSLTAGVRVRETQVRPGWGDRRLGWAVTIFLRL